VVAAGAVALEEVVLAAAVLGLEVAAESVVSEVVAVAHDPATVAAIWVCELALVVGSTLSAPA
jgi:hypothetical protein